MIIDKERKISLKSESFYVSHTKSPGVNKIIKVLY